MKHQKSNNQSDDIMKAWNISKNKERFTNNVYKVPVKIRYIGRSR